MRLSAGEIPADGQTVLWLKHYAQVAAYRASFGVRWWLDRDYDWWEAV